MKITCTAQVGGTEASVRYDDSFRPGDVVVIMVKADPDGKPVVESFEPLAIDNHPDTLREIGGRVVTFAENKL